MSFPIQFSLSPGIALKNYCDMLWSCVVLQDEKGQNNRQTDRRAKKKVSVSSRPFILPFSLMVFRDPSGSIHLQIYGVGVSKSFSSVVIGIIGA